MEKKGVIAILYKKEENERKYALFHRIEGWQGYEFLKGGVDPDETPEHTVIREIEEESGLKNKKCHKSKEPYSFSAKGNTHVFSVFFARIEKNEKVVVDMKEHDRCDFFNKEGILKNLPFENQKELFLKIEQEIINHEQNN